MGSYPNIKIGLNANDSVQQNARSIIAIFPYTNKKVNLTNYNFIGSPGNEGPDVGSFLSLRSTVPVILTNDIISLNINTSKEGLSHTLSSILAPHSYNYLALCGPSDYIMAWIVNSDEDYNRVLKNLQNNKPANDYNSGLKFLGQIQTIQENYRVAGNGTKIIRYNLNALGFQAYQSQVVFSPFITKADEADKNRIFFASDFFKKIGGSYLDLIKNNLSVQEQFIFFHKVLLGVGPGQVNNDQAKSETYKNTVKNAFNIPAEVAKTLGQRDKSTTDAGKNNLFTYADIISLIIGIQQYSNQGNSGKLGPDVVSGTSSDENSIFTNSSAAYKLRGKRLVNLSPTMNATIIGILQEHSNSVINEIYATLRPRPAGDSEIVPTLVCRQIPFSKKKNNKLKTTQFLDLPRFEIDYKSIMSYDISKSDALRLNTVQVSLQPVISSSNAAASQTFNVLYGGWAVDVGDIRRNGQKAFQAVISDDAFTTSQEQEGSNSNQVASKKDAVLQAYNDLLVDFLENQHLKYSGNIQTFGIQEPICIGENIQFGEIVGHIEAITHNYQVSSDGHISFSTSIDFSHGIHQDGDMDTFNDKDIFIEFEKGKSFGDIRGGSIKESNKNQESLKLEGKK